MILKSKFAHTVLSNYPAKSEMKKLIDLKIVGCEGVRVEFSKMLFF
jgi:hypothetical protein